MVNGNKLGMDMRIILFYISSAPQLEKVFVGKQMKEVAPYLYAADIRRIKLIIEENIKRFYDDDDGLSEKIFRKEICFDYYMCSISKALSLSRVKFWSVSTYLTIK